MLPLLSPNLLSFIFLPTPHTPILQHTNIRLRPLSMLPTLLRHSPRSLNNVALIEQPVNFLKRKVCRLGIAEEDQWDEAEV